MIELYAYASRSIIGRRDHQEDACAFAVVEALAPDQPGDVGWRETNKLLAVLADGMGGHVAGQCASTTACATFVESYRSPAAMADLGDRLSDALRNSNEAIDRKVVADRALSGMGCTLLAAVFDIRGLSWVNVGDSILYLYRDGTLDRLSDDHSMAPVLDDLARRGLMDPMEAVVSPRRHLLRSALTGREIELIQQHDEVVTLRKGDWVILASDGLDTLSRSEIAGTLEEHAAGTADQVAQALVDDVEARNDPYQDNTTVMTIQPRFNGPDETDAPIQGGETSQTVRLTVRKKLASR